MKTFKPMLAPNESIDINTLNYPLLASYKLDGIRCIFMDGKMYSRALKRFPNVKLWERFKSLADKTKNSDLILDGELLAKSLTFNDLSGITRQLDKGLPEDLKFYCFDVVRENNFDLSFEKRVDELSIIDDMKYAEYITQFIVHNSTEVNRIYEEALEWGCDGLILRDPEGRYKFGRGTIKEGLIFKLKPFVTEDSKIVEVIQATEVREDAEKKINELGRSVTSKKLGDRVLIDKASAFGVMYQGKELKVTIAMTDEEKVEIWKNKESYIGRWIEYKCMKVGMKADGLPRHPTTIRFRIDKD